MQPHLPEIAFISSGITCHVCLQVQSLDPGKFFIGMGVSQRQLGIPGDQDGRAETALESYPGKAVIKGIFHQVKLLDISKGILTEKGPLPASR